MVLLTSIANPNLFVLRGDGKMSRRKEQREEDEEGRKKIDGRKEMEKRE